VNKCKIDIDNKSGNTNNYEEHKRWSREMMQTIYGSREAETLVTFTG